MNLKSGLIREVVCGSGLIRGGDLWEWPDKRGGFEVWPDKRGGFVGVAL